MGVWLIFDVEQIMIPRISVIIFVVIAIVQNAAAWEPKSPKDCRFAFLMGMTSIGDPGSSGAFPRDMSSESPAA